MSIDTSSGKLKKKQKKKGKSLTGHGQKRMQPLWSRDSKIAVST